ncbi:MAG TPA: cation-translocating P-type ATPase [Edaphocola sp.]|nr:cation-translocating P-type ATPase [Edaphocola sp.]
MLKLPLKDPKFRFLLISVAIVLALEILSLTGIKIPLPFAPFVFATFIIAVGYEVLWHGLKALFRLRFSSISLLMLIACTGAFYLQEYSEAAVVILLYVLGEKLEDIGIENSKTALSALIDKAPKQAFIKDSGTLVFIEKIPVGTVIAVKPGDLIPLDGRIQTGDTTVDEAAITGEPLPKDKHQGDTVFAGTLNKGGYFEMVTTKTADDTTFSRIIRLTFEASAHKSDTQKFIQKFSKYYTPGIIILALGLFTVPVFLLHQPAGHWLQQAISLLVISCPCALVISTPVAIYAAIGNASSKGAVIKGGKYMEAIGKIKAIALDKTRTITYGNPVVSDVIPMPGVSKEELLACTAGAEIFSEHPLAQAVVQASRKEGFEPHQVEKFQSIAGKGATAKCLVCEDETILLGKLSYIGEHEDIAPETEDLVDKLSKEGKTSVVVSFGKGVAGVIALTDEVKPGSRAALKALAALNIDTIILSGDNEHSARYVAQQTGVNKVFGSLLPEDKAAKITELLRQYPSVAMVGDGINDAPALAQSTVGIAMGAVGSDTAIETANIALMNDRLSLIPFLVRLGRKTIHQIKLNTIGAIAVKIFFIILAFLGFSNLVLAIAADVGVTLVVILLSLRLANYDSRHL